MELLTTCGIAAREDDCRPDQLATHIIYDDQGTLAVFFPENTVEKGSRSGHILANWPER